MIVFVFIITIILLVLSGWIAGICMLFGFGPLMMRLLYFAIGLKSSSFIPNDTSLKTAFFIITLLVAFIFYNTAKKKIQNGTAFTRVIPDVKWSMVFFSIASVFSFLAFLFS